MTANKVQTVLSRVTCINRILTRSTIHLYSGTRLHNVLQNDPVQKISCASVGSTEHLSLNKYIPPIPAHVQKDKYNVPNKHVPITYINVRKNALHCGSGNVLTGSLTLKPKYTNVREFQTESVSSVGIFGSFLSQSEIVVGMQDFLLWLHATTGLPWWLTIITSTVVLRTAVTFPFTVHQLTVAAKLEHVYKEHSDLLSKYHNKMQAEGQNWNTAPAHMKQAIFRELRIKRAEMIVKNNCHPAKITLLVFVQLPLWVTLSFALRNIASMAPKFDDNAYVTFLEISNGGIGWINNLALPDCYYILPIIYGLTNLSILQMQTLMQTAPPNKFQKCVKYIFTGVIIAMIPVAATVPSLMSLYWATSSVYGLIQKFVLMSPKVRRTLRIPAGLKENPHPYATLWTKVQNKLK